MFVHNKERSTNLKSLEKKVSKYHAHRRPANQEYAAHDANSRWDILVNALLAWKMLSDIFLDLIY